MQLLIRRISLLLFIFIAGTNSYANSECSNFYPATGPFYAQDFSMEQEYHFPQLINIVSYNIAIGTFEKNVLHDFIHHKDLQQADVILLQEVPGEKGGGSNLAQKIAEKMKLHYVFAPAMVYNNKVDYGNAILSRYPIRSFEKILLPLSDREGCNQRIALRAMIQIGHQLVQFVSVHLSTFFSDSFGDKKMRFEQFRPVINFMQEYPKSATVLAGDFNSFMLESMDPIKEILFSLQFNLMSPDIGHTYRVIKWKLDYVFSKNTHKVDSKVLYDTWSSDHYPIFSQLKF